MPHVVGKWHASCHFYRTGSKSDEKRFVGSKLMAIDVSPCIVYNITHVTPSIKLVPIMWGKLCVWKMSLDPSAA